jgi:hypothetical protein
MKQSTTILNEAKPSSILLYSAPWNLILIKFKCSNCFITYKALIYSNFEILWKLKFLKLFDFFLNLMKFLKVWNFIKILNFNFFFNQKKFLKFWIFFFKFWTLNLFYIRLYFTVFLLARSNTRDIPFSNILISKKQFPCNKKSYCTLVQNQWMELLLHDPASVVDRIIHSCSDYKNN